VVPPNAKPDADLSASANERTLRASALYARLDAALVRDLARSAVRRCLTRGELLWRAGDRALGFTLIVAGLVSITRRNADGTSAIVGLFGPREHIGISAAVARGTYPADAVAAAPNIEVVAVDANAILARAAADARVAEAINAELVSHTHALHDKIRIMTAGAVPQRIATLLLHLVERFGDELEGGSVIVPVSLTRAELAQLVGATVETTIRTVSGWQKDGLFATVKDGFVVNDLTALRAIAGGA
jgi:CRP/FNR family transcriptional regulator, nitrogen oxide reductase regulator